LTKIKIIIDDFRISHIFDIEEPIPENELANTLQSRGYKVINDRVIMHPPIRAVMLNMAQKNNVNIIYQKETIPSYIGTSGRDQREVLKQFDILNSILTELDPTLHGRHTSTEMVMSAKVWGKFLPSQTLPSLAAKDTSKFSKLFEHPVKTTSITMVGSDSKSESHYSISFSPLYRSKRYYYVQLVNRDKDLKKVLEFADKGQEVISDAISILEQE